MTTRQFSGTDTTMLRGVIIKAKRVNAPPDLSISSNLHGGGNADQVILGSKFVGCATLADCLTGKVPGVRIGTDGTLVNLRNNSKMSVILDGNILDGSELSRMDATSVLSVEVLINATSRAIYGSTILPGGALIVTTRRGGDNYVTGSSPGLITYPFKGYYIARSFYTPKYDGPKTKAQAPDLRTTIYWNPDLITDKNGKVSFEYFNSDTKGIYQVEVQGIDNNGKLGRQVYRYKVE